MRRALFFLLYGVPTLAVLLPLKFLLLLLLLGIALTLLGLCTCSTWRALLLLTGIPLASGSALMIGIKLLLLSSV